MVRRKKERKPLTVTVKRPTYESKEAEMEALNNVAYKLCMFDMEWERTHKSSTA
jgi:hypothetical protein